MKYRGFITLFAMGLSMLLAACDFDGGVEQGRCVAYDPNKNTVTLVVDTTLDQLNPHYSGKIDTFTLPADPRDMGPAPKPGGLLMLEPEKNAILYYDPATRTVREMPVKYTQVEKDILPSDPKVKGKDFPIVDAANNTVQVYSPRQQELVTFQVTPAEISLPKYTWTEGDEARIAFRNEKRYTAIRFMNVSKTNIFTR